MSVREGRRADAKEKVKTVIISFLLSEIRRKRRYVVVQETETRRTEGREKEEKTRDGAEMRCYV